MPKLASDRRQRLLNASGVALFIVSWILWFWLPWLILVELLILAGLGVLWLVWRMVRHMIGGVE